jgi:ABC-type branched-subunit amino acid transport system substrate-binding protein
LVGYGSSDAVLPSKNQELFYMGFELALRQNFSQDQLKQKLITINSSNGSALASQKVCEELIQKGSELIVGFPTSHEALLAAKISKQNNKFAIFAGAGHKDLGEMGPKIITTGESMIESVKQSINFIKQLKLGRKGVVIVNPFAVFSQNQADVLKEVLRNDNKLDITFVNLDKDKTLTSSDLQLIKASEFTIITPYADETVRFLEQFRENKIDLPIITNSSWTTGDLESIRRYLVERKTPLYSSTLWLKGAPESKYFEQLVLKTYGREAVSEIAYGYDLGIIVRELLKILPYNYNSDDILNAFLKIKCFENTTSGKLCFNPKGGHSLRKIFFVQFNKTNFSKVKLSK